MARVSGSFADSILLWSMALMMPVPSNKSLRIFALSSSSAPHASARRTTNLKQITWRQQGPWDDNEHNGNHPVQSPSTHRRNICVQCRNSSGSQGTELLERVGSVALAKPGIKYNREHKAKPANIAVNRTTSVGPTGRHPTQHAPNSTPFKNTRPYLIHHHHQLCCCHWHCRLRLRHRCPLQQKYHRHHRQNHFCCASSSQCLQSYQQQQPQVCCASWSCCLVCCHQLLGVALLWGAGCSWVLGCHLLQWTPTHHHLYWTHCL